MAVFDPQSRLALRDTTVLCLEVQEPWAAALVRGTKTIETRRYALPEWARGVDVVVLETPRGAANASSLGESPAAAAGTLVGVVVFGDSVRYPGLGPSAALAARQMAHGGGVFAIECRSATAAQALPATLRLFRDATSLGGVESLAEWRRKYDDDVSPYLVRLSVGLEDAADLKRDLTEALETLQDPAYDDVGA